MAHVSASRSKAHQKGNVVGKRRGLKVGAGQFVKRGSILVRQLGTKWYPGKNTKLAKNYDIIATVDGYVYFTKIRRPFGVRTVVNVKPKEEKAQA